MIKTHMKKLHDMMHKTDLEMAKTEVSNLSVEKAAKHALIETMSAEQAAIARRKEAQELARKQAEIMKQLNNGTKLDLDFVKNVSLGIGNEAPPFTYRSLGAMKCAGNPYTLNPVKSCKGWQNVTEKQCRDHCSSNDAAPGCPAEGCNAFTHDERNGQCHLYNKCESTMLDPNLKLFSKSRNYQCSNAPYTYDPAKQCKGWKGVTVEQCSDYCSSDAQAPGCPKSTCTHFFVSNKGWCHLYDKCAALVEDKHGRLFERKPKGNKKPSL